MIPLRNHETQIPLYYYYYYYIQATQPRISISHTVDFESIVSTFHIYIFIPQTSLMHIQQHGGTQAKLEMAKDKQYRTRGRYLRALVEQEMLQKMYGQSHLPLQLFMYLWMYVWEWGQALGPWMVHIMELRQAVAPQLGHECNKSHQVTHAHA